MLSHTCPSQKNNFDSLEHFLADWETAAAPLGYSPGGQDPIWSVEQGHFPDNTYDILRGEFQERSGVNDRRKLTEELTGGELNVRMADVHVNFDAGCKFCHHVSHELDPANSNIGLENSLIALHYSGIGIHPRPGPKYKGDVVVFSIDHGITLDASTTFDDRSLGDKLPLPTVMQINGVTELCDRLIRDQKLVYYRTASVHMTIPTHDHGHAFPIDSFPSPFLKAFDTHGQEPLFVSDDVRVCKVNTTPISMLAVTCMSEDRIRTASCVKNIMSNMRQSSIHCHWAYFDGTHFIVPVKTENQDKLYTEMIFLSFRQGQDLNVIFKHHYERDDFDWEPSVKNLGHP